MTSEPQLSLIVSNYGYGEYLYETIGSVLRQTVRPDEIIIIDDCSKDHSRQVIDRLVRESPSIQAIFNPKNIGCNASINVGLKRARGKYACSLGADDPLRDDHFFARALEQCRAQPAADFCFGEHVVLYQSPTATFTSPTAVGLAESACYLSPAQVADVFRGRINLMLPTSPSLWKRTAFLGIGGMRDELSWAADWFAAMVLIARSGACYVPGLYQNIRFSPKSFSQSGLTQQKAYRALIVTILETLEQPAFADTQAFFRIPATLSRFGFKLLNVLASEPRFAKYLSLDLIRCAVMAESCPFTADLSSFGPTPAPDVVRQVCQQVLVGYSGMLTQHAADLHRKGQFTSALGFCRKALDALPTEPNALALLGAIERDIAQWTRPEARKSA